MATATLDFEKPLAELEKQIDELKRLAGDQQLNVTEEIAPLERVQVARSNKRPLCDDYLRLCFTDFIELHGDRAFREDAAIIGGWARLDGETVMVIGHQRGLGAEERGQSEAIARNLFEMSRLETPIIATVIGEGGSGGALALGVADRVNMLENAVYSVITVEGCAAILWKDGKSQETRERAATSLRITAPDLYELRVIDEIIPEPPGGGHADHEGTAL